MKWTLNEAVGSTDGLDVLVATYLAVSGAYGWYDAGLSLLAQRKLAEAVGEDAIFREQRRLKHI